MSEMIERVARAIETILNRDTDSVYETVSFDDCRLAARAAIAAMREPTDAIMRAADANLDGFADWSAMIDAALKETPHA